jgi:hypothetical protein
VLGDDQAVPKALRDRFRSSGLYHLLSLDQKARTRPSDAVHNVRSEQ